MRTRLLSANIQQQDAPLAEVESLLRTLGEAWSAIRSGGSAAPAPQTGHTEERWAGASFTPEPEYAAQAWSA
jgi:hypothetical protein